MAGGGLARPALGVIAWAIVLGGCRMYGKLENPEPVRDLEQPVSLERVMRLTKSCDTSMLEVMLRAQAPSGGTLTLGDDPVRLYSRSDTNRALAVGRVRLESDRPERIELRDEGRLRIPVELPLPDVPARLGQEYGLRLFWETTESDAGVPRPVASRFYRVRVVRVNYLVVAGLGTVLAWTLGAVTTLLN